MPHSQNKSECLLLHHSDARLNILSEHNHKTSAGSLRGRAIINALTIDVEDYFQIHAFSKVINNAEWDLFESTVDRNTHRILDLLDSHTGPPVPGCKKGQRQRATFFVLGWVAKRYPALIREIHARGHEVACHGYAHQTVFNQSQEEFRDDVSKAKAILEDLTGTEIIGYRAPTYSITRDTLWTLKILFDLGFRYDSSIFPIKHDFYGFPEAPRFPFYIDFSDGDLVSQFRKPKYVSIVPNSKPFKTNRNQQMPISLLNKDDSPENMRPSQRGLKSDSQAYKPCGLRNVLVEFPLSTISLFGRKLPCSGGGFFRLFPYWYTRRGFNTINTKDSGSAIFYIHPWEFDPELPVISSASALSKFRTYVNLKETEGKFRRLLSDFSFAPLASFLGSYSDHSIILQSNQK